MAGESHCFTSLAAKSHTDILLLAILCSRPGHGPVSFYRFVPSLEFQCREATDPLHSKTRWHLLQLLFLAL